MEEKICPLCKGRVNEHFESLNPVSQDIDEPPPLVVIRDRFNSFIDLIDVCVTLLATKECRLDYVQEKVLLVFLNVIIPELKKIEEDLRTL